MTKTHKIRPAFIQPGKGVCKSSAAVQSFNNHISVSRLSDVGIAACMQSCSNFDYRGRSDGCQEGIFNYRRLGCADILKSFYRAVVTRIPDIR